MYQVWFFVSVFRDQAFNEQLCRQGERKILMLKSIVIMREFTLFCLTVRKTFLDRFQANVCIPQFHIGSREVAVGIMQISVYIILKSIRGRGVLGVIHILRLIFKSLQTRFQTVLCPSRFFVSVVRSSFKIIQT